MKKEILLLVALLLTWVLASCAPMVAEARVTFCQNLETYGQAVLTLQTVDANTMVDELTEDREDVVSTRQALLDSATDLRNAKLRSAEEAWSELADTVQNVPGDASLGEVGLTIRAQAAVLQAEIARLNNVVCSR